MAEISVKFRVSDSINVDSVLFSAETTLLLSALFWPNSYKSILVGLYMQYWKINKDDYQI